MEQIILTLYLLFVVAGVVMAIVSECNEAWVNLSPEKMGKMLFIELCLCVGAFLLCLGYVLIAKEYWWLALMALPIVAGQITARVRK